MKINTKTSVRLLTLAAAATLGLARPGVATTQNLYVANAGNNSIEKYGPGTVFASTGLSTLFSLAFDNVFLPVPEPSTLALLGLGGAGMLGLTLRHRRTAPIACLG